MDYIHDVRAKKAVPCEGNFILMLKAVNVAIPRHHRLTERSFHPQVVPGHPLEVSCDVAELLVHGDHVDSLVQELACLFLGE